MRPRAIIAALLGGFLTSAGIALLLPQQSQSQTGGRRVESVAAFEKVASVLVSPRCQNCHTLTTFPRQGDDRHPHLFNVARGSTDLGGAGLPCSTCHGRSNNPASGVPGAPEDWRLAPMSMGWEGLSTTGLCQQLKDPQHNGHRTRAEIINHLRSALVKWAWSPGTDRHGQPRTSPSIPYPDFVRAAETWVRTGAACP